jgi:hypothetical protein
MMIQGNEFGDLGWGWKSLTKVVKKAGKGVYNVAKMPAAMARRVAASSASVLCDKQGNPRGSDATSRNFCRAVKLKQTATLKKYLPAAAKLASRTAQARKIASASGLKVKVPGFKGDEPDVNLLADLAGADMNDLSFALAGVTPIDIGAVAPADVALFAPSLAAVGVGLWLLYRG